MRIAFVVPGFGDTFYCENCVRDLILPQAIKKLGHDVVLVPMCLPISPEAAEIASPLFYGAVNVYLKEAVPFFRWLPGWLTGLLDSPYLLRQVSRFAGSTRAAGLESLTLSVLRGEDGHQAGELEKLVEWLHREPRPDIVHLSNGLLLGLARRLKQALGVPVVCSLQDEDQWIETMDRPERVWELMAERAEEADALVPVSRYYANLISQKLCMPPERLTIIPNGMNPDGYSRSPLPLDPPVIGFLSRLSQGHGLWTLVEAFIQLRDRFPGLKLRATGGWTADDRRLLKKIRRTVRHRGLEGDVRIDDNFGLLERQKFLASLTLLSVPMKEGEAFGGFLIESMAAGVPVVQPRIGAFPEIIERTGGGLMYGKDDDLADQMGELLDNPHELKTLSRRGREGVMKHFSIDRIAGEWCNLYESF